MSLYGAKADRPPKSPGKFSSEVKLVLTLKSGKKVDGWFDQPSGIYYSFSDPFGVNGEVVSWEVKS